MRFPTRRPLVAFGSAFVAAACVGALFVAPAGASQIPVAPKNAKLAAEVPAGLRSKTLVVAADATYAPDEFVENGKIVGMDVDLANAIAQVLGLKIKIVNATFDTDHPRDPFGQVRHRHVVVHRYEGAREAGDLRRLLQRR